MSNQIVISSGAKVRSLEGVLTGTAGIVNSVPLGGANGVATLDALGKVPLSQLPASVVTYLGTWNAATNTPTLTNGVGDVGDLYICNVAGTVNFGAGPITFAAGDWVIYSGTEWQKSAGASGTVTSVAVTESGDALTITGSPITTSGTINIGFAGNSTQYINGAGNLTTFPSIITEAQNLVTEVYNETGATLSKGSVVYINGGHGNLPTVTKAQANSEVNSAQTYGLVRTDITNNNNGYVTVAGRLENIDTSSFTGGATLYLSPTTAGAYTTTKPTSPDHIVYVGVVVRSHPTQGVIEVNIQNTQELAESSDVLISSPTNNQGLFYDSATSLWKNNSISTALGYTPANDALVVHLAGTETITGVKNFDIGLTLKEGFQPTPATGYIGLAANGSGLTILTKSGATVYNHNIQFQASSNDYNFPAITGIMAMLEGTQTFIGDKTFSGYALMDIGVTLAKTSGTPLYGSTNGYANLQLVNAGSVNSLYLIDGDTGKYSKLSFNNAADYTYTFPASSGTLALTSNLSSYVPYTGATASVDLGSYDLTVYNIKVGRGAGGISTNTLLSYGGLQANTTGYHNVAIGTNALLLNTTGYGNTAIGSVSSQSITTGFTNTAIGYQTLGNASTASGNTVVGYNAGLNITTGSNNTIIGSYAATSTMSNNVILADGQGTIRYQWDGTDNILTGRVKSSANILVEGGSVLLKQGVGTTTGSGYLSLSGSTGTGTGVIVIGLGNGATSSLAFPNGSNYSYTYPASSGTLVLGTGTTNYLPKFTGASTIGDSAISDNGTTLSFGRAATFSSSVSATKVILSLGADQAELTSAYNNDFKLTNSGNFRIINNSNTAALLTVQNNGNVGIGVTPATFDTIGPVLQMGRAVFYGYNNEAAIGANFRYEGGDKYINSDFACLYQMKNGTHLFLTAPSGTAGAAMTLTERMRIGSQGNVGIGQVNATDVRLFVRSAGSGSATYNIYSRDVNAVDLFAIRDDGYGYLKAAAWAYGSDRRIKENINYIESGLDKILALKPAIFDYIDGVKNNIGWIAQDVQEVIPEAVNTISEDNDQLTLKSDFIIPYLVKAIQEQQEIINQLSAKVTALENKA